MNPPLDGPKKNAKKNAQKKRLKNGSAERHVLDQLYAVIDSHKDADPDTSYTARLFSRGRRQIAKKLGEEAVIEGVRGDRPKLVGESVDLFYQLLTLWAAVGIKPRAVWSELARRENLSSVAESATSDSDANRRK